jgi:hypothetical protein
MFQQHFALVFFGTSQIRMLRYAIACIKDFCDSTWYITAGHASSPSAVLCVIGTCLGSLLSVGVSNNMTLQA